jgi:hypothetical protein
MHKRLLITYFLTTLLFCCVLLHAGKTPVCKTTLLQKIENTVVKAKAGEELARFIPSVLLF